MLITLLSLTLAIVIDWLFGEAKHWHPLMGFGKLADLLERHFNLHQGRSSSLISRGLLAWLLAVIPLTILAFALSLLPYIGTLFSIILLYFCIGHRSLYDHVRPIIVALDNGDLATAKLRTSYIVSRDKDQLDVEKASIESILENGNDAIFGALFWFIIAGAPGVALYRLSNTLDAMWGYKNTRFLYFGRVAARMDDVLNYIPARLTALSYALAGQTRLSLRCWFQQAHLWDSPNAGPVMAAGAGALDISLGGEAVYAGQRHQRPLLGSRTETTAADMPRALQLISRAVMIWLAGFSALTAVVLYA